MKITIDTSKDNHQDIKKVIKLLSHLVGDEPVYSNQNVFNNESPEIKPASDIPASSGNAFANMFGDLSSSSPIQDIPKAEEEETDPKEDPDTPKVKIVEY